MYRRAVLDRAMPVAHRADPRRGRQRPAPPGRPRAHPALDHGADRAPPDARRDLRHHPPGAASPSPALIDNHLDILFHGLFARTRRPLPMLDTFTRLVSPPLLGRDPARLRRRPDAGLQRLCRGRVRLRRALGDRAACATLTVTEGDPDGGRRSSCSTWTRPSNAPHCAPRSPASPRPQANLRNLETGSREAEIEVIRASLEEARAQQALARSTLTRTESLFAREIVTQARVDNDRAALEQANAHVAQLEAQLEVAELPARDEQVVAAEATLDAARAEADLAAAQLDDMQRDRAGERPGREGLLRGRRSCRRRHAGALDPAAGRAEGAVLPARDASAAPSSSATGWRLPATAAPSGIEVTITRMASDPQYTPPIIYSRDERARLIFRAEATAAAGHAAPARPAGHRWSACRDARDYASLGQGADQVLRRQEGGRSPSTWTCPPARSTASSAPTARARPRRSG